MKDIIDRHAGKHADRQTQAFISYNSENLFCQRRKIKFLLKNTSKILKVEQKLQQLNNMHS